jgi:hypothetical protein
MRIFLAKQPISCFSRQRERRLSLHLEHKQSEWLCYALRKQQMHKQHLWDLLDGHESRHFRHKTCQTVEVGGQQSEHACETTCKLFNTSYTQARTPNIGWQKLLTWAIAGRYFHMRNSIEQVKSNRLLGDGRDLSSR